MHMRSADDGRFGIWLSASPLLGNETRRSLMFQVRHVVLALMLGATVACSDDDNNNKSDGSAQASEDKVTVSISAKEGGEVKLGEAALKIPAGALSEDLEVTVESKKPAKSLPEQD